MAVYTIFPNRETVHGSFSKEFETILSINSGDTVKYSTLDAGWGSPSKEDRKRIKLLERRKDIDSGHALIGPIFINGAKKGMTLEIRINETIPGPYGFTSAGEYPNWQNQKLGLTECEEITLQWELDNNTMIGTTIITDRSFSVNLRPFMGIFGMPPDEPGIHSTFPPRFCGGNLDCKELTKGSTLYLPIAVDGGYFSVGDGHAAQGDGEISCQAIECPIELVELTFTLREDKKILMPQANTPSGWITFGFHEDLNEATVIALDGMLNLMGELFGLNRVEAMALGSIVVDLRITQVVNGIKGVHAVLPHGALR
ncbi:acetamidase/formamidase family protein [Paenibacillus eucommiae]|uniref:Acetamidase/formamidase n=1 Tax=Paenibacillus eucommiae TaxID=1355755 RepID=A0ABS4J6M9_9BACL|nr:acetamidase/formamidase family protein [Paenibacillus eucommiae]MBP1995512.1 acetamidase/formamidase [Paenibacillus eucommiae]